MKRIVSGIMLTLLLTGITLAFIIQPVQTEPTTIVVPDDYPTIQEAINNANEGDTIFVKNGTYDGNVVVSKSLTLVGEKLPDLYRYCPTIRGIIDVEASDASVRRFRVAPYFQPNTPVFLDRVSGCEISEVTTYGDEGAGIWLWYSSNNVIANNTIRGNVANGCIRMDHSFNNTIIGNYLYPWTGGPGISLYNSSRNIVHENIIEHNYAGIIISNDSPDNQIFHNNFIRNTYHVWYLGATNVWDNGCEGNYWDNYNGTDLDGDGIGDTDLPWEDVDYYPLMSPFMKGDVNHDCVVDITDVVLITARYRSQLGDENWNCHSDIAEPYGIIDISDVVAATSNYRRKCNP